MGIPHIAHFEQPAVLPLVCVCLKLDELLQLNWRMKTIRIHKPRSSMNFSVLSFSSKLLLATLFRESINIPVIVQVVPLTDFCSL
jgi:hypothetical protein